MEAAPQPQSICHGRNGWELVAFDWQGDIAQFTYRRVGYTDLVKVERAREGGPVRPEEDA